MACRRLFLFLNLNVLTLLSSGQPLPLPTAPHVSVAVLQRADLICSLEGYTGSADEIKITIMKSAATSSSSNVTVTDGGLTSNFSIAAATSEDGGAYICVASVIIGELRSTNAVFNLQVRDELALMTPLVTTTTMPGSRARFSCIFNSDVVVSWFRAGSTQPLVGSSKYEFSGVGERVLTINDVSYSDMGAYACQVTINGMMVEFSADLTLTPAYVPLRSEGQSGQSLIVTTDQLVIRCPVNGVPGPDLIYWQKGIDTNSSNLTNREDSRNDPFVDDLGRLDFSDASIDDEGRYRCTAVDELGSRNGHVFFVEITHVAEFFLWTQWYLILVYCIVGVVMLVIVVLVIWFLCSVNFNWCVRVKKVVRKRERVRRSTSHNRPLVMKTPTPRDEGIDTYAVDA